MADPRFFDNHGPFALAEICSSIGASFDNEGSARLVHDVGNLSSTGPQHLSFFGLGGSRSSEDLARSCAGFCIVPTDHPQKYAPSGMTLLVARSVQQAFAAAVALFYPENTIDCEQQADAVNPSARLEKNVILGPNAVIGANVEIGDNTQIGANAVIGKGVVIGRRCRIGSNVSITHAYIGDDVLILPGACLGQPGFGFVSSQEGHTKIPQLGRVIVQDRVEIGSCATIDRGALGDTVVGEGSKLDNLVQIGHNTHIGRNCMIVSQVGISGSCEIGDYVVMGGQVGIADHVRAQAGARFAARAGVMPGLYNKGDWAGMPAIPAQDWRRQTVTISRLSRRRKRDSE